MAGGNGDAVAQQPYPAAIIGSRFVKEYYTVLAKAPQNLHKFYKAQSVFSRGVEGTENIVSAVGPSEIHSEIMANVGSYSGKLAARTEIVGIESQESRQGGVLVMVTGYITYSQGQEQRHFMQAFFLDKQTEPLEGYFVLNDILRYVSPSAASGPAAPRQAPPAPQQAPVPQQQAPQGVPDARARPPAPVPVTPQSLPTQPPPSVPPARMHHGAGEPPPGPAPGFEVMQQEQQQRALQEAAPAEEQYEDDYEGEADEGGPEEEDDVPDEWPEEDEVEEGAHDQGGDEEEEAPAPAPVSDEKPKSWAAMLRSGGGGGGGAVQQPKPKGFSPVLPPPTAAAKAEAVRAAAKAAAKASAAAEIGQGNAETAPQEKVRMYVSKLPADRAPDGQDVLDCINTQLAEWTPWNKAVELDMKESKGKDFGYVVMSSQEAADAVVQLSKDRKLLLLGKTLKVEAVRPPRDSQSKADAGKGERQSGGKGRAKGEKGRGGSAEGAAPPGGDEEGGKGKAGKGGKRGAKGGGREGDASKAERPERSGGAAGASGAAEDSSASARPKGGSGGRRPAKGSGRGEKGWREQGQGKG